MFNLGQFRGSFSDITDSNGRSEPKYYKNIVGYQTKQIDSIENTSVGNFTDIAITLPNEETYEFSKHFYLRFSIDSNNYEQTFTVYLQNASDKDLDNRQKLQEFTVPANTGKTYYFDLLISPDSSYNMLVFTLKRITIDYSSSTGGRILNVNVNTFQELKEVLNSIGVFKLTKFAIQSVPGLIMCINGEEIHIGRTGIYELIFDDVAITSIALALQEGNSFIIDYQY